MVPVGFAVFETAIGPCGLAWSSSGVTHLQLPEASPAATRARLQRSSGAPEAPPPPPVATAIADVVALLSRRASHLRRRCPRPRRDRAFREGRLLNRLRHSARPHSHLWRDRLAHRRSQRRARGRPGARAQSDSHHNTLPQGACRRRQDGRLLGKRRGRDQAQAARDRGMAAGWGTDPVRRAGRLRAFAAALITLACPLRRRRCLRRPEPPPRPRSSRRARRG